MEQFGTNIASALVGLATNQKFNFSLMIMNGMLGHISNGTPFLMYPRFIQLFLNKQLEGVARPQDFIPSVTLPSKIFTFMRKHSPKFSCKITPLTPHMLEVVTALAAEEAHSTSPHSRDARDAQGTPDQSAAQASVSQRTAEVQGTDTSQRTAEVPGTANSQGTAEVQGTADFQGTAEPHGAASIPKSPNDYTPTDASQTSGGDEGLLDLYALNREVRRLKKQTLSQAKLIRKLKAKLKNLSKVVAPVVKHHAFWVESQHLKKQKRRRKKQKKKVSSVKLGRNKEEEALERKSDETEEINVEEKEASNVKSGDTEELDWETFQSTARQSTITPRTLNFEDEAATDPKDKGKGILVEEPKKKKLTLQQIRALETTNDEEVARKIQAEWDAEEERKRLLQKILFQWTQKREKPDMKESREKRLLRKRKATISEEQPSKRFIKDGDCFDELRNYLRIVDFEKSVQDRESLEGISMITELQVIDSPDGEYLIIHRANNHFRAFDTLWEILHILDRQDLYHLYR
ncbi:hypothetical protein Tco_0222454 [Tanacetum coccineum]